MCRQASAPDAEGDDPLAELEAELTRELPGLFEAMNRASSEVNTLECQTSHAQERYKQCLEQWRRLYQCLRSQHGAAIDCAKPYFDTTLSLEIASRRVQHTARKLSAVGSEYAQAQAEFGALSDGLAYGAHEVSLGSGQQDDFSRALARVLQCKEEHGRCEEDHSCALHEYRDIKGTLDSWRSHVSQSTIRRMQPCFKQLQHHQLAMASEQVQITELTRRTQAAKQAYSRSMCELESINVAVHQAREDHARSLATMRVFGEEEFVPSSGTADGTERAQPSSRLSKATPESTPEAVVFGEDELVPTTKLGRISEEVDMPFLRLPMEAPEVTPELISDPPAGQSTGELPPT